MKWKAALFIVFLSLVLMLPACSQSGGKDSENPADLPDFLTLTGLDRMQESLDNGAEIVSAWYDDADGVHSGFTTEDPEEIQALWEAVRKIQIDSVSEESATDLYPQISFTLSDGKEYGINFEHHWLRKKMTNYNLSEDKEFWGLTRSLVEKYEEISEFDG